MVSDNLRLAIQLRDSLLAELRQNQTFRAYLSAQETVSALIADANAAGNYQQRSAPAKKSPSKPGTQTQAIETAAAAYLREKGSRAPSTEISKVLLAKGVAIGGKDPSATVSAFLTHSSLFDNIRGQGYGLAEWSSGETETPNSSELFGASRVNGASR
jgi:hypothetical protein